MKPVSQLQHSQFNGTHEQHHLKVFAAKLRSQRRENSSHSENSLSTDALAGNPVFSSMYSFAVTSVDWTGHSGTMDSSSSTSLPAPAEAC